MVFGCGLVDYLVTMNKPMPEAPAVLEFPCRFPIKAMGRNSVAFESEVVNLVTRHATLEEQDPVSVKPSKNGNFLSVTVVIQATSRDQLDRIYQSLTDCTEVLMVL